MPAFDANRALDWITRKCAHAKCPMCQRPFFKEDGDLPDDGMDMGDSRLALMQISGDSYDIPVGSNANSKARIAIELNCHNCGYIMLFRADKILGV
jgi:hypothetical protein